MKDLIARIRKNDETLTTLDLSTREDDISYYNRKSSPTEKNATLILTNQTATDRQQIEEQTKLLHEAACQNNCISHLRLYSSHVDSVRGPELFAQHLGMIQHLQGLRDLQIYAYCVPPHAFLTRQLARVIHRKQQQEPPSTSSSSHDKQQQQHQQQRCGGHSLQRLALHQVRMDPHDRTGQILLARAFASLQEEESKESSSSSFSSRSSTLEDLEWDPFPFSAATTDGLATSQQRHNNHADGGTLVVSTIAKLPLKRLALTGRGGGKTSSSSSSMTRLGLSSQAFAPMFRIQEALNSRHRHHHHLQSLQLSRWILDNADCKVLTHFLKQTIDLTELDLSGCIFYGTNNNNWCKQKPHANDDSPMAMMKSFETNASVQYLNLTDCQFRVVPIDENNNSNSDANESNNSVVDFVTMEECVYATLTRAVESHNYTLSWVKTCPLLRDRAKQEWRNVHVGNDHSSNIIMNNKSTDDCKKRTCVMDILNDLLILNRSAMLSTPGNINGSTLPSSIRKSLTGTPPKTWSHIIQRTSKSPTALFTMLRGNADQLFCFSTTNTSSSAVAIATICQNKTDSACAKSSSATKLNGLEGL